MLLKLIKEAQLLSVTPKDELAALRTLQAATGKSLTAIAEAFVPTDEDYKTWLDVVIGVAEDAGESIRSKDRFMELLGMVWENDSKPPPVSLQHKIGQKLWLEFKAKETHAKISSMGQNATSSGSNALVGHENEESGFAQAVRSVHGIEDEQEDVASRIMSFKRLASNLGGDSDQADPSSEEVPGDDAAEGDDERSPEDIAASILGSDAPEGDDSSDEDKDACPDCTNDVGVCPKCGEHMECEHCGYAGSEHDHPEDEVDAEAADDELPPDELDAPSDEDTLTNDGVPGEEDGAHLEISFNPPSDSVREENEEYSEEEAVKSFFRQAVTSPKDHMTAALKDIEAEGASAWMKLQLEKNPHPKKSPAHRAWQKGFTNTAKDHLGIADKPAVPSKQKVKKR